jgi:hypothetical protein
LDFLSDEQRRAAVRDQIFGQLRNWKQKCDARLIAGRPVSTGYKLLGNAKGSDGQRVRPLLSVDSDSRIIEATCTCQKFKHSKLTQGPCEHMLALRLLHMQLLEE